MKQDLRTRTVLRLGALGLILIGSGCATGNLDHARSQFYSGHPQEAAKTLAEEKTSGKDRVLVLMERGIIRQGAGQYEESVSDFRQAYAEIERMTSVQVSQDTTSMVVNDKVQDFRGAPYERTMIHVFAAQSHLAMGNWENAAVEARRIINSLTPEAKGDYPDDAFSRYMAGFCLEMMDDFSNAALQYRKASELGASATIDEKTGRLGPASSDDEKTKIDQQTWDNELVCFVSMGRSASGDTQSLDVWKSASPHYAEIKYEGKVLGRSYTLTDTIDLAFTTEQKEAAKKFVKSAARVAVKETIAYQIEGNNEALGELVRFVLIGLLEAPDLRRWETLPRWLQVARVPCPPDLKEFDIVYKTSSGVTTRTVHVTQPIQRRRNTRVAICRDVVPATAPLEVPTTVVSE